MLETCAANASALLTTADNPQLSLAVNELLVPLFDTGSAELLTPCISEGRNCRLSLSSKGTEIKSDVSNLLGSMSKTNALFVIPLMIPPSSPKAVSESPQQAQQEQLKQLPHS